MLRSNVFLISGIFGVWDVSIDITDGTSLIRNYSKAQNLWTYSVYDFLAVWIWSSQMRELNLDVDLGD